jgi:hypothetical protein
VCTCPFAPFAAHTMRCSSTHTVPLQDLISIAKGSACILSADTLDPKSESGLRALAGVGGIFGEQPFLTGETSLNVNFVAWEPTEVGRSCSVRLNALVN